jgi:hypothetical protein
MQPRTVAHGVVVERRDPMARTGAAVGPYRRCRATNRRGGQCEHRAMHDQDVCRHHGGSAPQSRARVARDRLSRDVARELASLGADPVADPLTALSELAGQVVAWKNALAGRVNELTSLRYEDDHGGEQLRAEVALWERALDRCNTVLATMARLRIDERLAAISERQAERVLRAIDAALDAAGVPATERAAPKKAAAVVLRGLPGPERP